MIVQLPVSGRRLSLRQPTGVEDLPLAEDLIDVAGARRPDVELERRCLCPAGTAAALRARAARAMAARAPSLTDELSGGCPECGRAARFYFDARTFCLRELQAGAR